MENNEIKKRILKSAMALYNACSKTYEERRCKECPFSVIMGCNLFGHPIEWKEKLKTAKGLNE
jgi:hypothetical protein